MLRNLMEDFDFALGEKVAVGDVEAVVVGQATFAYRVDDYLLSMFDENDLPCERWFPRYQISKLRTH